MCVSFLFQEKANLVNEKLCSNVENVVDIEMLKQINDQHKILNEDILMELFDVLSQNATNEVSLLFTLLLLIFRTRNNISLE